MKKLMILGASFPQVRLINAARALGYQTVVCSIPGRYPGFAAADEVSYTDISNPAAVLNAARQYRVDGVATCCLDTGVQALGYTCEALGLPGLTEAAAVLCADKLQMKKAFLAAGVSTADFREVRDEQSLVKAFSELTPPVILKAVDLQGSRGIYVCRTAAEAREKLPAVLSASRHNYCVAEEFLEGEELGAQAFVYHGKILFVLPHGDVTYLADTNVPIGHYVPMDAEPELLSNVEEQVRRAIAAVGLDNCAVNVDLLCRDGCVYVIELTGRAGATCLPETVGIWFGLDYYKMIASMAAGDDPTVFYNARTDEHTANVSRMLLSEKSGLVTRIEDRVVRDEYLCEFSLNVKEGDRVEKFTNAKDRLGQIVIRGASREACFHRVEEVLAQLVITVE